MKNIKPTTADLSLLSLSLSPAAPSLSLYGGGVVGGGGRGGGVGGGGVGGGGVGGGGGGGGGRGGAGWNWKEKRRREEGVAEV
ncbi:hypothetical protein Hanom_Chr05g00386401 [Helianthus anomalus]